MTMFDPARGAVQDPTLEPYNGRKDYEHCARCGHRYASHGDKGCKFVHQRGMLCPCKAFRKGNK